MKITKNKAIKAGIGYTVGNYLLKGINFLTVPIFTRIMTTEDYGIYSTYVTYDSIIAIIIGFALHSSLKNAKYKYKDDFNSYVSSILILPMLFLAFMLAIVNAFPTTFSKLLDLNRIILNILFVQAFSNAILQLYNSKLGLDYQYKDFLKISFINTFLNLVLSFVLMFSIYSNEKYQGRIVGGAIPLICIVIFIYASTFKSAKPKVNLDYWKFGLAYSLPIIPHGLSQVILSSFDKIMIRSIVGASQAGIYSLGINIESLVKVTTTSLDAVWGPWFYERMNEGDEKTIKQVSSLYAYGIFIFLSCLMIASPELVYIMGSESYSDAKYITIPLLACTYFTFLYTLPATIEYYYQKTGMIALGTIGAAIINVMLNTFCINRYGYQAAAYTTLVSYFFYFCFHYFIAKKLIGRNLFNGTLLWGFIIGIICVMIFSLIVIDFFWIRLLIGITFLILNGFNMYRLVRKSLIKRKNS